MEKKFLKSGSLLILAVIMVLLCGIGVRAQTPGRYDVAREGILSGYYRIDPKTGFITGIAQNTSSQRLLDVCVPATATASTAKVVTGTKIQAICGGSTVTATAIVTGDLNGDGTTTISDMLMLKSAVLGQKLTAAAAVAGDLNGDGSVTVTDFLKTKAYLLGLEKIVPVQAKANSDMLLMTPDTQEVWAVEYSGTSIQAISRHLEAAEETVQYTEATTEETLESTEPTVPETEETQPILPLYESDNEAVVTVSADGVICAHGEGSAFVYALDEQGAVLERRLVTVLREPLTISLEASACQIAKGQTKNLSPVFNHPVSPRVRWNSLDPAVVTVENGKLTGKSFGTATVTATLDNGSQAKITVKVAPPITAMRFAKSLYKVKPNATRNISAVTVPADGGETVQYKSSDPSIASVSSDGVVTGKKYGTVTITATGKYSGLSASCKVKICDVKQVAFTFDDGPAKDTARLLDFLKENDLQVTFFMVGERLSYYPNTVKRMAQEGHELGYHSYAHEIQTKLKSDQITKEFQKSNQLLKELTGKSFTVWRTPGGGYNDRVLSCVPLPHILWSVDSQDWVSRNSISIYKAIRGCKDGSIVLLHDLHSFTVDGAIRAMREMAAGDYEFVTVSELLSRDGTPPENGVTYRRG